MILLTRYCMKLIFLDIDGTLTNDQKVITPKTRDTLLLAEKKGIILALASARPTHGLYKCAAELEMRNHNGLLMAYNGGRIVDLENGKVLSETHMDLEKTRKLLVFLESLPVTVILDDGEYFYVTDQHGYKVSYECQNNQMTCREVDNLAEFLNFSPIKLLLSVAPDQIMNVQNKIQDHIDDSLSVVRTAAFYLEIIPRSINKGTGLLKICTALGIDPKDALAFGDSENDIPMLETAGCGVAMENAEDALKKHADFVTLSNNEDGIAAFLESRHIISDPHYSGSLKSFDR